MGKLRGFVEFDRVNEDYISVERRIKNFKEFTIKPKDCLLYTSPSPRDNR